MWTPDQQARRDLPLAAIVFLASLAIFLLDLRTRDPALTFEGISVVGADRVLAGQVPYRDFWTIYAPGSFYLLAVVFKLFGNNLLVGRVAGAVLMSLSPALMFLIARRWSDRRIAFFVAGVTALLLIPATLGVSTYSTVLPCLLAALLAATKYFDRAAAGWLLTAGAFCSLAMLFKHDVGLYIAISIGLTLLLTRARVIPVAAAPGGRQQRKGRRLGRELALFALGCLAIGGPVYAVLYIVAGHDIIRDLLIFPLTDFPRARPEHYPGPIPHLQAMTSPGYAVREISFRLMHALPAAVALTSAALLVTRRRHFDKSRFAAQLLLTLCFPFFWNAAHVQKNTHIFTMSLLCAMIGSMWAADILQSNWTAGRKRLFLTGFAGIAALAWLPWPVYGLWRALFPSDAAKAMSLPRARGIRGEAGMVDTLERAITFVRTQTSATQPVYVGTDRHDLVITSAPLIYALLERRVPVRYHELHPGIADTAEVQTEMVAALRQQNVQFCILWRGFESAAIDRFLPGYRARLPQVGCRLLDDYICANFEPAVRFGRFTVLRRRPSASAVHS